MATHNADTQAAEAIVTYEAASSAEYTEQSSQADVVIHTDTDVYLSLRELLATAEEPKAVPTPTVSVAEDATKTHSHFAGLLSRILSEISTGGQDSMLSEILLPGLAHLVRLIEESSGEKSHEMKKRVRNVKDNVPFAHSDVQRR
jgi:hypothetical protein